MIVATPGFQRLADDVREDFLSRAMDAIGRRADSEPSFVVGRPSAREPLAFEDDGRTAVLPINTDGTVYAKRDDYPPDVYPGKPVITFLLADEY